MKQPLLTIKTRPLVSVIVPTYNGVRWTAQLFASLARTMQGIPYEIIVVDNGSTDETLSFVGSHTPGQLRGHAQGDAPPLWVKLLHNTVPRALSLSWNMGIDAAEGAYYLITNNDVIYAPGAVRGLVDALRDNSSWGVALPECPMTLLGLTPTVQSVYGEEKYVRKIVSNITSLDKWDAGRRKSHAVLPSPDPFIPQGGFSFMLPKRTWEKVGRFDEDYELTGEDYDYFSRVRRHFKMCRVTDSYVHHFEHQTCRSLSHEYNERLCRGRFLLTEKQEGINHFFSVVIPVFNRVDTLRATLDSLLAQTFPHWRCYIVDDGSDDWDRVEELMREYGQHRNRIWLFRQPTQMGPGVARNTGLALSEGKYVAFLDSDDIWYPKHLERHFQAHENSEAVMVYSDPDFAYRSGGAGGKPFSYQAAPHETLTYMGDYDKELLLTQNFIQTSSVSVLGTLARSCKFPANMFVGEDWEYFKEVADAGGVGRPVYHLPERTCRYHISRQPHEEDHLIKRAVPSLSGVGVVVDTQVIIPLGPEQMSGQVGVVIPTKERPEELKRALLSAGGSPVVAVDDGSFFTSTSREVVEGKSGVALLRTELSQGPSFARNRGIEYLQTEWVKLLDDDDTLVPGWQITLAPLMDDPSVDAIIGAAYVPAEGGKGFRIDKEIFTSQLCIRRSSLLQAGLFDETLAWAEERDLIGRMEIQGMKVVFSPEPVCVRSSRGGSGRPETARAVPVAPGGVNPFRRSVMQ